MKVYVAGAWVEKKERAEVWIARLREAGVEITHDWTTEESGVPDAEMASADQLKAASSDCRGVYDADVLWLLAPNERGASGAWTEFGLALGLQMAREGVRPLVVASGAKCARTIFTALADWKFPEDEKAFEFIVGEAAKEKGT